MALTPLYKISGTVLRRDNKHFSKIGIIGCLLVTQGRQEISLLRLNHLQWGVD